RDWSSDVCSSDLVPLVMLAQAPSLRALVAEQLGCGEPPDRLAQRPGLRADHAREGRCHLGTQRHRPAALVLEVVELPDDLLAALLDIEFELLERRTVVLLVTVAARHFAPGTHDVRANSQIGRIEVAETRK